MRIGKNSHRGARVHAVPSARPAAHALLLGAWSSLLPGRLTERSRRRPTAGAPAGKPAEERGRPGFGSADPGESAAVGEAADRLLDEITSLAGVDAGLLALTDEDGGHARGFAARGVDAAWWRGVTIDLRHDASAIASAARERAAFAIFDIASAPNVSRRLADAVGAKSAAFVPALVDGRVVGVVVAAATADRRFFTAQELASFQAVANAAAPVLERSRSADALRRSLERERLVGELARKARDRLDLDEILGVAVRETGRVLGADRCFVRLGAHGEPMQIAAEWRAPNVEPIDERPERLAVSNLALRERRTVALADVATAPELDDAALGSREGVVGLGSRAVLATPIVVFDNVIGSLAVHRTHPTAWAPSEGAVVEAIAGEIGLAVYAARLLDEDARRLGQQSALLNAAQVVTSDLRLESVLERLVEEVATLSAAAVPSTGCPRRRRSGAASPRAARSRTPSRGASPCCARTSRAPRIPRRAGTSPASRR
jgi:GAF domain-containing protein